MGRGNDILGGLGIINGNEFVLVGREALEDVVGRGGGIAWNTTIGGTHTAMAAKVRMVVVVLIIMICPLALLIKLVAALIGA